MADRGACDEQLQFESVWSKQVELVIIIPHKDNIRNRYATKFVTGFNTAVIQSLP